MFIFRHIFSLKIIIYFGDNVRIKEGILKDGNIELETLEVMLPGTTLLILEGYGAFAMCGALDVNIYNSEKMIDRKVICMKALGVKTLEELYESKIADCCDYAKSLGVNSGIYVKDAFKNLYKE